MGLTACPQSRPGHANCMEWHKETRGSNPTASSKIHIQFALLRTASRVSCIETEPDGQTEVQTSTQTQTLRQRQANTHRQSGNVWFQIAI